jgi:hypothetical protein
MPMLNKIYMTSCKTLSLEWGTNKDKIPLADLKTNLTHHRVFIVGCIVFLVGMDDGLFDLSIIRKYSQYECSQMIRLCSLSLWSS